MSNSTSTSEFGARPRQAVTRLGHSPKDLKSLALFVALVLASLACAEEASPDSDLDREIEAFRKQHGAYNAVLINNSAGRALNKEGQVIGSEALGTVVNPQEVLIIARAMVADPVVELYTSIKRLPDCAHTVRILYTESPDRSESSLLGYTIENPKGVYTKLVKYDGKTPWLEWITASFKNDDREQVDADQPATAPESKTE